MEPEELADARSQFYTIEPLGLKVHIWHKPNTNSNVTFVMQHGLLCGVQSFLPIWEPLSQYGTLIAFDRPGFGLTSKLNRNEENWKNFYFPPTTLSETATNSAKKFKFEPNEEGHVWVNPYSKEFSGILCKKVLEHILGPDRKTWGKIILIGHSLGGLVSAETVLRYPDLCDGLVLIDPAIYTEFQVNKVYKLLYKFVGKHMMNYLISGYVPSEDAYLSMKDTLSQEQIALHQRFLKSKNWEEGLFDFWDFAISMPPMLPE